MIERRGSQYRIRLTDPIFFVTSSFRTKDVGKKGGLQLILGRLRGSKKYSIQSLRVSVNDFYLRQSKTHAPEFLPLTKRGYKELLYIKKLLSLKAKRS